jgi:DNA repair exonuclease SbcCD nuclease subunit
VKPFSFVHTADLHLDSPFVGLRDVDEKVVREIREATFHTFDRIIDLCLERNADFLLVAGDIYDSRDRSLRAQLRFRDGLRRLSDEGISSFVVHGNHDPLDSWAATLKWPERAHIFGGNAVTAKRVERDGQTIALVYGISYPTQEVRANLATKFRRHDEGKFAIGLLHCNVGVDTGHEPYAPCSMKDLASAGMDYWALGHVHNTCVLSSEEPMIVYPGNPQGRTPLEVGARGCYFVEVRETGRARAEFVPVDSVRWQWKSIPVEELGTDEAVVSAVERACQEMREDAGGRPVVGRISLSGRGPAYASLARPNFVAGLVERLHETEGSDDPFVWIERVEVNVRPPLDLEARRAGQDFVADLLNLIEGYRKDPERITFLREHLKPLFQARRAHRHLEPPSDAQLRGWLEAAEAKCADLLTAEED